MPTIKSSTNMEGSCVLPDVKLFVHDLPAKKKPIPSAFHTSDAPVEFIYCLSGGIQIFATDGKGDKIYSQINEGKGTVLHLPLCNGSSITKPGTPLQIVGLQISPAHLSHLAHATGCPLHPTLKRIVQGSRIPCFLQNTPLPLPLRLTVEQILSCHPGKGMRNIFLEYKKIELLYLQLNLLNSQLIKLKNTNQREIQAAHNAHKRLMEDLISPPGLQELATLVGLNRSQLNKVFRSVFGDTVFGVMRQARLECARRMLECGTKNVTEVAYECGFSNPSHLTKSFSDHFSVKPKHYQKLYQQRQKAMETNA
ncbi:MAG: helix-turn-helix transcriptional regulator [Pseudodesulfovibrio sp.]|nr:helix-turn-helix transcriptional regulator [Pseudodesulfovibrio sp.]